MSKKPNRECKVCGEHYYFCPNCSGSPATEKYRTMFCSKNCRDVFQTCVRYNMKHITKDEAKFDLSQLDLSKRAQFSEQLKADIDEIMKIDAPQIEIQQDIPVVDLDEAFVEAVSITPVLESPVKKSKRGKRATMDVYDEAALKN